MTSCDRCPKEPLSTTMSYFNTDTICMDCSKAERAHPGFKRAQEAEIAEVRNGNYNFAGVGVPADI